MCKITQYMEGGCAVIERDITDKEYIQILSLLPIHISKESIVEIILDSEGHIIGFNLKEKFWDQVYYGGKINI